MLDRTEVMGFFATQWLTRVNRVAIQSQFLQIWQGSKRGNDVPTGNSSFREVQHPQVFESRHCECSIFVRLVVGRVE